MSVILRQNWSKMVDPLTPLPFNWVCTWTFKYSINSLLELNQWLKGSLHARQSYKHYYDKNLAISVHMYLSTIPLLKFHFKPIFYHIQFTGSHIIILKSTLTVLDRFLQCVELLWSLDLCFRHVHYIPCVYVLTLWGHRRRSSSQFD